jgi:TPR repeat protein
LVAFDLYKRSAMFGGYLMAYYKLGLCYLYGKGSSRNERKAFYCFKYVIDRDITNVFALYELAICYENGYGLDSGKNEIEAFSFYSLAADLQYPPAIYSLALCYLQGKGIEKKDIQKGLELLRFVANTPFRYPAAMNHLGYLSFEGKLLKKNYSLAISYYQNAADLGYMNAQYNLAFCYEKGYGVVRNYDIMMRWYEAAAYAGHLKAKEALVKLRKK